MMYNNPAHHRRAEASPPPGWASTACGCSWPASRSWRPRWPWAGSSPSAGADGDATVAVTAVVRSCAAAGPFALAAGRRVAHRTVAGGAQQELDRARPLSRPDARVRLRTAPIPAWPAGGTRAGPRRIPSRGSARPGSGPSWRGPRPGVERRPGHYPGSPMPGERATSAVAAHRAGHGDPFIDFDTPPPGRPGGLHTGPAPPGPTAR